MNMLRLAYYGDDFTGSTDALEFLTRAGIRTVLFTAVPDERDLARYPGLGAVGVAGFTRALSPDDMERELTPAFTGLRALAPRHVHYKVCSTFDSSPTIGSIGRAIEVGGRVFGGGCVPLVVGAPSLGRYCVFGNLFARFGIGSAGAIHRLDRHPAMSRHPVTPAGESDLRRHLARQTAKRIDLLDVLALSKPEPECRRLLGELVAGGAEVILFDVLEPGHLERIGALLESMPAEGKPFFSVGSSAIEMALGVEWNQRSQLVPPTWAVPEPATPLLVVSGSCSPVTVAQIAWAIRHGFVDVGITPTDPLRDTATAVRDAVAHLQAGHHVIVHSSPERGRAGNLVSPADLGAALGGIAREVIAASGMRRLLVAGGDTSSFAARRLGIAAVEMIAPLAPGAPLCRAYAPGSPVDGMEVNFKGGQVGAEDYFGTVARGKG